MIFDKNLNNYINFEIENSSYSYQKQLRFKYKILHFLK